jgi:hypothetical protein
LQEAMTNDPTLLGLVQSFAQMSPTDSSALGTAIANIMFEWAGVAGVAPTSRGPAFDAREPGFLEQFLGTPFRDAHGQVDPIYAPEQTSLAQSWNAAFDGIAARLVLGAGIDAAQLAASADAQGDLLVSDGISGDRIKLDWMALPGASGVGASGAQTMQVADGTTWAAQPYVGGLYRAYRAWANRADDRERCSEVAGRDGGDRRDQDRATARDQLSAFAAATVCA